LITNKVVGREPAFVVQSIVAAVLAVTLFFNLSPVLQGLVTAVVVGVGGVVTAAMVAAEKALPLLEGLAKAVLALIAGLGVDIPGNVQAGVFALLAVFTAYWMRGQVTAPVPAIPPVPPVPPITRATGGHL
jgi:hypothetical protein